MKILVVDDCENNLKAAIQTLKGHEVTVVGSHDEALEALDKNHWTGIENELKQRGLPVRYEDVEKENFSDWYDIVCQIKKECPWDAVLCDLLMPAGKFKQGGVGLKYVGQEMPIGWSLAIQAALSGAKYVAVITAGLTHHDHPAVAMLDNIVGVFQIAGARAIFGGACMVDLEDDTGKGKDWGQVLSELQDAK